MCLVILCWKGIYSVNRFMQSQVNTVLISMKTLDQSIELAAQKDDGVISKEEKKQIRKIRKAIIKFQKSMDKLI